MPSVSNVQITGELRTNATTISGSFAPCSNCNADKSVKIIFPVYEELGSPIDCKNKIGSTYIVNTTTNCETAIEFSVPTTLPTITKTLNAPEDATPGYFDAMDFSQSTGFAVIKKLTSCLR